MTRDEGQGTRDQALTSLEKFCNGAIVPDGGSDDDTDNEEHEGEADAHAAAAGAHARSEAIADARRNTIALQAGAGGDGLDFEIECGLEKDDERELENHLLFLIFLQRDHSCEELP